MEEKDGGLRFFRAVLKRSEEYYDMISACWGLEAETMAKLRSKGFDMSKVRKFLIIKDYCKVFGLVTTLQDLTEKDIDVQYVLYKNNSSEVLEQTLNFKEWNYPMLGGDFERDVIENTTHQIFNDNFIGSRTLFICIFNAFGIFNDWTITRPKKLTQKDKEIIVNILKTELSYGRKRKKSIVGDRPSV